MAKITSVVPGEDYFLTIRLDNSHSLTLDMKRRISTIRFSELRDEAVFRAAKTDGKAVYWPGGFSLDLGEIMEIAGK